MEPIRIEMNMFRLKSTILASILLLAHCHQVGASTPEGLAIAERYEAVFKQPPVKIPSDCSTDAPLMGNGDLMVALGGAPELQEFYIGKADLWRLCNDGGPRPLARLDLEIPSLKGATYLVRQNLAQATTTGIFKQKEITLTMETAVAATENTLWVKLTALGGSFSGEARLVSAGAPVTTGGQPLSGGVPVELGCENKRWYLNGDLDRVAVYSRALSAAETAALANTSKAPTEGLINSWYFNDAEGTHSVALVCNGKDTHLTCAPFPPLQTVTVSAFVKIAAHSSVGNAEYILSQGEWSKEFSLGLSAGAMRMSVHGEFAQSAPISTGQWVHVAGTYDGKSIRVYVNGKEAGVKDLSGAGEWASDVEAVERKMEEGMIRPSGATCAMRVMGGKEGVFTVTPGRPVWLLVTASGLANIADFPADAIKRCEQATPDSLGALDRDHLRWWADFWSKSFVEIPDQKLEQRYCLSNYCLGCASRLWHFPPGLYGWVTTDNPMWGGTYFMNYNFFAPFYSLYAGNHLAQSNPCNGPILDFLESGREWCRKECHLNTGVLLPVSILPYGITGANTALHQRTDASYGCVTLASTWYATYDLDFAKKAYPFVREVATFWEHRLTLENDRYVDRHDAVLEEYGHEPESNDVNPIVALALIRQVMNLAIDMSTELGIDSERHDKWADIRDRMSDYPKCTVNDLPAGSRVELPNTPETRALPIFRYTEQGTAWQNGNAVGIQHIFPGNGIGLDSSPDLLARARNQISVMARWIDLNGCNSFYPAAARVGYDPETILKNLNHWVDTASPNGMRAADNPHGMEQFSVVPCTLQEMLFQSYDGVLRFFPCWPANQDARFGTLRARGAFLVCAELKSGQVGGVKIFSEKGRDCTVINPWPGKKVERTIHGKSAGTFTGGRFTFKTKAGETFEVNATE